MASIEYIHEKTVDESDGDATLLDISLKNGIPHMHVCGGRARCSTCRVMVVKHPENAQPRNDAEKELAKLKGFEENIRLACQTKVAGPVAVRRLVIDREDVEIALAESPVTSGRDRGLALMFTDVRGFTTFSEKFLPYDVIHILNRYFRKMGEAVLRFNGTIDKYMGDGLMALFGEHSDGRAACLDAVRAGLKMLEELKDLNAYFKEHFDIEFRIGIGVHFGEVVLGEIGHPKKMSRTAIGDAVNHASRIESTTKKAGVEFLVSHAVYELIRDDVVIGKRFEAGLKGKSGRHRMYEIKGLRADVVDDVNRTEAVRLMLAEYVTRDLAPAFLRLAFHDAVSGTNGSIRFAAENSREGNRGLEETIPILEKARADISARHGDVSFADLVQLAGAVAVEKCEGPRIEIALGRPDAEGPAEKDMIPGEDLSYRDLASRFAAMGLSIRDFVALSGAHTLGRARGLAYTDDLFNFTNSYFKRLLKEEQREDLILLASDLVLLKNEEAAEIVRAYALDEELFFRDFADAYVRMSCFDGSNHQARE